MSIDFCKIECQTNTNKKRFGIYDAEDNSPAILKYDDENSWNAIVINDNCKRILFTAIDNCIEIKRANGDMDNRCDCMLTYEETLLLIELKNKRDSWQAEGLSQIEATIKRMINDELLFYNRFKRYKAIVANRKNQFPSFQESNKEQREYFKKEYKIRIQFETEIIIK
jgi:hypothetical protein